MSSVGQAIGGIVGATIGFIVAGPKGALYGAQIGMTAGGIIDPPKGPDINGPRLSDLSVQTSTYGAFVPRNYGTIAQSGNVFWLQGDKLTEVQTTTESGGKGGPSSTTTTWSYFATFAVGLCEGPIDGIRKIWIGPDLFYDASDTNTGATGSTSGFTLYTGTDTQLADPLIQADKGVANTPAYRGLAYIVFHNLALAKYSNSLLGAQVKVEIVKSGTVSNQIAAFRNAPLQKDAIIYNPLLDEIWVSSDQDFITDPMIVRLNAKTGAYVAGISNGAWVNLYTPLVFDKFDQCVWAYDGGTSTLYKIDARVGLVIFSASQADNQGICLNQYNGELWIKNSTGFKQINKNNGSTLRTISAGFALYDMAFDQYSNIFFTANDSTLNRYKNLYKLDTRFNSINSVYTDASILTNLVYDDMRKVVWAARNSATFVGIDVNSFSVYGTITLAVSPSGIIGSVVYDSLRDVIWSSSVNQLTANNVSDVTVYQNINGLEGSLGAIVPTQDYVYVIGSNPITFYGEVIALKLDLITSSSVALSTIVEAECLTSALLSSGDIDVTELTDIVRGYKIASQGAIRGAIDPLMGAWPFDVIQSGYKIKFKKRGSASVVTIPESDLDARPFGSDSGISISNMREMDSVLPRKVNVKYLDVIREYDVNEQYEERLNTDSVNERTIDLPIAFNATEARQKAEMLLYLYWMERYDISFKLPSTYAQLEPGDVVTITAASATYTLRLTRTNTLPDGRIECQAKYSSAALYVPAAIGSEGQSVGGVIPVTSPSAYRMLDIPLIRDDDDTAGFPVAMSGYQSGWPGGVLYRSDDNGTTWQDIKAFSPGQKMGVGITTLSAHGGTVFDKSSTLSVRMYSGDLSSVTEAQMLVGQNWFAYGSHGRWEIIAAQNCVLQGDGSYILSDFLRGQNGTEWATGLHVAGDDLIYLSTSTLEFISVNSSTINSPRLYRGITSGRALDSDLDYSFTYSGVNLECLSPVHLTGDRHPSTNDWNLTWIRRSRYNGWRDLVDTPLGETSEAYEIDVYADGTYATVKRTLTSSTPSAAYTSANQVTDFGSNQATLYLKIYQLSSIVGRGYPLTQSITR